MKSYNDNLPLTCDGAGLIFNWNRTSSRIIKNVLDPLKDIFSLETIKNPCTSFNVYGTGVLF